MSIFFLHLLIVIISIEATTELLCKSKIFSYIREYFFNRRLKKMFRFINDIFDCPYCMSVWVSFFYLLLFYFYYRYNVLILIFLPIFLVLHRLSNILHFLIDRINKGHL